MRKPLYIMLLLATLSPPALAADKLVKVELGKGELVKLDKSVTSLVLSEPTIADVQVVSPKLIMVRGKKVGETSLYAVDASDTPVFSGVVEVTHNLSKLQRLVKEVAPDADVRFSTVDGGLVMDGTATSPLESANIRDIAAAFIGSGEKMVNTVQTAGSDQVMLKVKIVEMQRSDLKRFGINLQNVMNNGNFSLQLLQGNDILFHTSDPKVNVFSAPANILSRGTGLGADSNLFLRYKDVNGLLDALETNGLANVLAEPSLTTTSGKAASFLAGGQFPIPAVGDNGTVTIQYQPFGVSLNFTPVVLSKERMSITVAPEVSTLDFNNPIQVSGITYPILATRKASSVVELGSGQSFMLAGLLKKETSNSISKFPGLGDVPILGTLFRSQSFQNDLTELVILVTPYVVHPVSDRKLQTPADGYVPPNELQRLLLGNLYQQEPMKSDLAAPVAPTLSGAGGFMLDCCE